MMPIRSYSPDFPHQSFSTFGPIPGLFRVHISVLIKLLITNKKIGIVSDETLGGFKWSRLRPLGKRRANVIPSVHPIEQAVGKCMCLGK